MYDDVSFITAAGEEIWLSSRGLLDHWETLGRSGFEAPELEVKKKSYADGSSRLQSVRVKGGREVTLKMVCVGENKAERDRLFQGLVRSLIQTGGGTDTEGKLVLRRYDGSRVFLKCVYASGMNIAEQYRKFHLFSLKFSAGDPFFYAFDDVSFTLRPERGEDLYFSDALLFADDLYFSGPGTASYTFVNDGVLCFPLVTITGPAANISLRNEATGKTLWMEDGFSLGHGEILEINTREMERGVTLIRGGKREDATFRLALDCSLNWEMVPGENPLTAVFSADTAETGYQISFKKRYYSV